MDDLAIRQLFQSLWDDLKNNFGNSLLAHYTSINVIESVFKNNEVWFSNPLFMNDYEEVKFAIFEAVPLIQASRDIETACQTSERSKILMEAFNFYYTQFANEGVMDTYIFCLTEHSRDNADGSLSMWRGYGSNGNGAAIVVDPTKFAEIKESPLIFSKVHYVTKEELLEFLNKLIVKFVTILGNTYIPDNKLYLVAFELFERVKLLSLFVKHKGFEEEKEWRIVYMKERDYEKRLESMISYWVGPSGIEPKLKLKINPIEGVTGNDLSLEKIVDHIILGPSISTPLAKETILRMLNNLGKTTYNDKIFTSSIPYRVK